ncbi:CPBP family intramembrane glutamic endopeptidase [Aphanothece sacrum]|uniref:Abortive phage infection protein n=1 Tax=Aphanothece sacrum FPU1 TaxID=1920663 RepID=A0A401IC56_APHSA|nr:CPBP family intramembrane glutamic endopeptidase [Aphanothece sacrum]GBF78873.1 abortive phage infection protein [Aphanothece sacrum FPU1]GBF83103.1 abortive phage infection protein [Aphanothece sacrum FPU3]
MTNPNSSDLEPLTRTQILIVMGVTAIILLIIAKVWQKLGSISILETELTYKACLLGLAISGGIILASSIIYRLWPAYRQSADNYLELVIKPLIWPDIIWLGLLPGLSEELLFRGVMLPALGFNLTAVIISSLVFGILHLSSIQQWPYVVWATIVGFVLGYSALITGNLVVPIVAHILTNLVSSSFWKLDKSAQLPSS